MRIDGMALGFFVHQFINSSSEIVVPSAYGCGHLYCTGVYSYDKCKSFLGVGCAGHASTWYPRGWMDLNRHCVVPVRPISNITKSNWRVPLPRFLIVVVCRSGFHAVTNKEKHDHLLLLILCRFKRFVCWRSWSLGCRWGSAEGAEVFVDKTKWQGFHLKGVLIIFDLFDHRDFIFDDLQFLIVCPLMFSICWIFNVAIGLFFWMFVVDKLPGLDFALLKEFFIVVFHFWNRLEYHCPWFPKTSILH